MNYCTNCGTKSNYEQSLFCTACGQRFPQDQSASQIPGSSAGSSNIYTTERISGSHKFVLSDFCLKDTSGKMILTAKKKNAFGHANYDILDSNDLLVGVVSSKGGLGSVTLSVDDATQKPLCKLTVSRARSQREGGIPEIIYEDVSGGRLLSLQWLDGFGRLAGFRIDGAKVFDAVLNDQSGGMLQEFSSFARRKYTINLLEPNFSLTELISIFVAAGS
jgi:hypothetical protein